MRELKFRAWVGSENTDFIDMPSHYEYDITIVNGEYADVEAGWDIHGTYENVPVEQYTGLKDKNGKEIYEGDIVEYVEGFYRAETSEFEDIKDTGIVVWNTEYSGFMIQNFDGVYGTMGECEVIGNVHENGELLRGEQI